MDWQNANLEMYVCSDVHVEKVKRSESKMPILINVFDSSHPLPANATFALLSWTIGLSSSGMKTFEIQKIIPL